MGIAILILFSVFTGTSWYIAHRIWQGMVSFFPNLRFWPVLTVFLTLALVLVLGFGRSMLPLSPGVKGILGLISACCMGVFIYLFLYTAASDLILAVPRLMKLPFTGQPRFRGIVAVAILTLTGLTCCYGFLNARQIDHVSYEVRLQNKTDISDVKMVLISDLHLGSIGSESRLEEIVDEINGLDPDVVCIAGDFFDTDFASIRDPEAAIRTLQGIRATYGTYACLGNHDAGKTVDQMTDFLERANIRLLSDASVILDDRLVLVGRLDGSPIGGYGQLRRRELSEFLPLEDKTLPVVVLDHNPAHIHTYGGEVDLILCGHTHRGQLFPGGLITNAMYAVDYGYYREAEGAPQVIVTSGIGSWGMPMRVGTNCEIVTVRFICE